jgi:hypothetical protein
MYSIDMLAKYKKLLEDYHKALDQPNWELLLPDIVAEMNRVWNRLSGRDRQCSWVDDGWVTSEATGEKCLAYQYAALLYERRIG